VKIEVGLKLKIKFNPTFGFVHIFGVKTTQHCLE